MATVTTDSARFDASSPFSQDRSVCDAVDDARFAMLALQLEHSPANAGERREAAELDAALDNWSVGADFVSMASGTVVIEPTPGSRSATTLSTVVDALDAGHRVEVHLNLVASDVARLALRRMANVLPIGRLVLVDVD